MANGEGYIVIISSSEGVVLKGIERKLQSIGLETRFAGTDMDLIKGHLPNTDIYIIYLSSEIANNPRLLSEMDKLVRTEGREMVIIGEKTEQDDARKSCVGMHVSSWIDRPVDMDRFVDKVKDAISKSRANANKKHILVVDDDPTYSQMVQFWLKETYKVSVVSSGMDAIKFVTTQKVDLILLDYEMPVVSGPQTLEILRSEEATKSIPVVFLTGKGKKEDVQAVVDLKPDGYILKSTTKNDLLTYLVQKMGF